MRIWCLKKLFNIEICNNKLPVIKNTEPEDVYFSYYMRKLGHKIPNQITAAKFSIEHMHPKQNSTFLGGHQFWYGLSNWEKIVKLNI